MMRSLQELKSLMCFDNSIMEKQFAAEQEVY